MMHTGALTIGIVCLHMSFPSFMRIAILIPIFQMFTTIFIIMINNIFNFRFDLILCIYISLKIVLIDLWVTLSNEVLNVCVTIMNENQDVLVVEFKWIKLQLFEDVSA